MKVVYADILFVINFIIDYLCIYITARVLNREYRLWRLVVSAAVGGIYSVIMLYFPNISIPPKILFTVVAAGLICLTAFGFTGVRSLVVGILFYFAASALMCGLLFALFALCGRYSYIGGGFYTELNLSVLIPAAAVLAGLCKVFFDNFKRAREVKTVDIMIKCGERQTKIDGLIDSGCLVKDPLDGSPVILVKTDYLVSMFGEEVRKTAEADFEPSAFPVPMRTVVINTPAGSKLLFGFKPTELTARMFASKHKHKISATIALDSEKGSYGGHGALVPTSLLDTL